MCEFLVHRLVDFHFACTDDPGFTSALAVRVQTERKSAKLLKSRVKVYFMDGPGVFITTQRGVAFLGGSWIFCVRLYLSLHFHPPSQSPAMHVCFRVFETIPIEPSTAVDMLVLFITNLTLLFLLAAIFYVIWRRHDLLVLMIGPVFVAVMCTGAFIHVLSHFLSNGHLDTRAFVWARTVHCPLWDFWGEYFFGFGVWYTALFLRVFTWYISLNNSRKTLGISSTRLNMLLLRGSMVVSFGVLIAIICLAVEAFGGTRYDESLGYCNTGLVARIAVVTWLVFCCVMLWFALALLWSTRTTRVSTYAEMRDVILASTFVLLLLTVMNVSGWTSLAYGRMVDTLLLEGLYIFSVMRLLYAPVSRWITEAYILKIDHHRRIRSIDAVDVSDDANSTGDTGVYQDHHRCGKNDLVVDFGSVHSNPSAWDYLLTQISKLPAVRAPSIFQETVDDGQLTHEYARMFSTDISALNDTESAPGGASLPRGDIPAGNRLPTTDETDHRQSMFSIDDDDEGDELDDDQPVDDGAIPIQDSGTGRSSDAVPFIHSAPYSEGFLIRPARMIGVYQSIQNYKTHLKSGNIALATCIRRSMLNVYFAQSRNRDWQSPEWDPVLVTVASSSTKNAEDEAYGSRADDEETGSSTASENPHLRGVGPETFDVVGTNIMERDANNEWCVPLLRFITRFLSPLIDTREIVHLDNTDSHAMPLTIGSLYILGIVPEETKDVAEIIRRIEKMIMFVIQFVYFPQVRADRIMREELVRIMRRKDRIERGGSLAARGV